MNPEDARLCAEESELEELWVKCERCHGSGGGRTYSYGHNPSHQYVCPACHGKGEIPDIGPHNIVYLEAWLWNECCRRWRSHDFGRVTIILGEATGDVRRNAEKFYGNAPARAEGSVRIIAEAIRESKK